VAPKATTRLSETCWDVHIMDLATFKHVTRRHKVRRRFSIVKAHCSSGRPNPYTVPRTRHHEEKASSRRIENMSNRCMGYSDPSRSFITGNTLRLLSRVQVVQARYKFSHICARPSATCFRQNSYLCCAKHALDLNDHNGTRNSATIVSSEFFPPFYRTR
jgi:hypothetical protein